MDISFNFLDQQNEKPVCDAQSMQRKSNVSLIRAARQFQWDREEAIPFSLFQADIPSYIEGS